jgi:hypothetical protein
VPKHLLNIADVGAALQHEGRHRVPEQMAAPFLADAAFLHVDMNEETEDAGRDGLAIAAQEYRPAIRAGLQLSTGFAQVPPRQLDPDTTTIKTRHRGVAGDN